jgi:hypothetical protein
VAGTALAVPGGPDCAVDGLRGHSGIIIGFATDVGWTYNAFWWQLGYVLLFGETWMRLTEHSSH